MFQFPTGSLITTTHQYADRKMREVIFHYYEELLAFADFTLFVNFCSKSITLAPSVWHLRPVQSSTSTCRNQFD
jgi:hypothetical protein